MPFLKTQDISLYYELLGNPTHTPVLLISGLGGVGKSWGSQIERFAQRYQVILPDQRGTGQTTRSKEGYTTQQLGEDMAALIEYLAIGPVHVVGSSTGGAIAQYIALNHPGIVHSLTLSSSFARFDPYTHREFEVRRKIAAEWDDTWAVYKAYSLFLFCPRFTRAHPERVLAWIERAAVHPVNAEERAIAVSRIDMIASHDTFHQLDQIQQPTLVLCGDHNFCTPLPLSEELAEAIPGAEFIVFKEAGELIELEQEVEFFQTVSSFIDRC